MKKHRTNWHEAAVCAVQIELRDYADLLDFQPEYTLGKNKYRIDMLIIKKLITQPIPKNIARIFRSYNLFEIKGIGSSVKINSYYKTIGYAGLFIDQISTDEQHSALDLTITFLCFHYPRELVKHLTCERNLVVAKSSPGVYYINNEIFNIQIIVTKELPSEENLYLRCLTSQLQDADLINRLADDYKKHQEQDIYIRYLHQLTNANNKAKGGAPMVCEGLLNLFGTSSEEIIARTKKEEAEYYLPKINMLSAQLDYLKDLLNQNHISFDLESLSKPDSGV